MIRLPWNLELKCDMFNDVRVLDNPDSEVLTRPIGEQRGSEKFARIHRMGERGEAMYHI
jgi:hypothetical protein